MEFYNRRYKVIPRWAARYSMMNDCPLFVFNFLGFEKRFPLCFSLESVKAEYRLERFNQLVRKIIAKKEGNQEQA